MLSPMTKSDPPRFAVPFFELVETRMTYGSKMLRTNDRRFFRKMMKSARRSDVKISFFVGVTAIGCVLVTDFAPGEADKDVFECHGTTRGLADERVVPVLVNEVARRTGGQHGAMVDDGDPVTYGLGLLH